MDFAKFVNWANPFYGFKKVFNYQVILCCISSRMVKIMKYRDLKTGELVALRNTGENLFFNKKPGMQ
jgi:carbonic anhydrase